MHKASSNETGHAKNVSNFDELISIETSFGTVYNPAKPGIKLTAMQTLATSAKTSMTTVNTIEATLKLAINARLLAFKLLTPLMSRVMSALLATDTTAEMDELVRSLYRKIQGRRVTPYKTDEELKAAQAAGEKIIEHSSSQMGYNTRIDNIEKLIKLLTSIPQYIPNEADLKVTVLGLMLTDLKAKNAAVIAARTQLSTARQARNEILYKDLTGLVDIAFDSKMYLKSVYGIQSPQYKQISKLAFTKAA